MSTRFTVIVPTHDRVGTSVLAVRSALAQTRPPERVVVVCDGCTDGTQDAMAALGDPRVVVLSLPKAPGYGWENRNPAVDLDGDDEVIAHCSDDDLWLPDHLEHLGRLWDAGRFDLVQSTAVMVLPDDSLTSLLDDWSVPELAARLWRECNHCPMSAVTLRAGVVRRAGGWRTVEQGGDRDLWRRVLDSGARTAASPWPTVLFFRALDRDQPMAERAAQNTRWLARVQDPAALADLRADLARAVAQRADWAERHAAALEAQLAAGRE